MDDIACAYIVIIVCLAVKHCVVAERDAALPPSLGLVSASFVVLTACWNMAVAVRGGPFDTYRQAPTLVAIPIAAACCAYVRPSLSLCFV